MKIFSSNLVEQRCKAQKGKCIYFKSIRYLWCVSNKLRFLIQCIWVSVLEDSYYRVTWVEIFEEFLTSVPRNNILKSFFSFWDSPLPWHVKLFMCYWHNIMNAMVYFFNLERLSEHAIVQTCFAIQVEKRMEELLVCPKLIM